MDSQSIWKWQVVYSFYLCSWGWVSGQLRYSILEETEPGTVVGNVAHDLGLNLANIIKHEISLGSEGARFFSVDQKSGTLTVNNRIDRESLCGSNLNCLLHLEVVSENPLELYSLEIEILDINDNSPIFPTTEQIIKITELLTSPGVRFPIEIAEDSDVGINGVKQYRLNPNPYFSLSATNRKDGTLIAELILDKALDREEKEEHKLMLTAFDGGEQTRSGSTEITIIVLDINDNAPVFDQEIYKISLPENVPLKTVVLKLSATDLDDGLNSEIIYSFDHHTLGSARKVFELNPDTGEIYVAGIVDFEEANFFELSIKAVDKGLPKMEGRCLVQIEAEDVNDNTPEIFFTSKTKEVPENAAIGTVVGFISVRDKDSGKNGEILLALSPNVPFKCQPFNNRYSLVTSGYLDREKVSQYTIQLIASDMGSPSLQNQTTVTIRISDINDNPPMFFQSSYKVFIKENNEPGNLLCTVSASDPDEGDNAKLKYSIAESLIDGSSVSSFVYINAENGNIYAQRSMDYEQFQMVQITAKVEDSGSPKLFSNVSVFIFVLDTNDNHPTVLYPDTSGEVAAEEKIPMSASAGYLVTKVTAVDLDSGHNAWLAYSIFKSTIPSMFQISEYTGEIRTLRSFQESDSAEQQLVIAIRDHGDPSLSATVTVFVNIVDNIAHEYPKSQDFLADTKPTQDLTLYLIVSLIAISLVSLVTFIILLVKCLRRESNDTCGFCFSTKSQSKQYAGQYQPALYLNTDGTLKYMEVRMAPPEPQGQCYPVCFPPPSEQTDFTYMKPLQFPELKDMINETEPDELNCLNDASQVRGNNEKLFFV